MNITLVKEQKQIKKPGIFSNYFSKEVMILDDSTGC